MELRVLRYFLMVAREENITRAAEKLHITQPTLSRQLMQLEEDLGATLFRRNNHRITLTEDGMLLKRRAQELLELAEKTRREFQSREELTGEIAIGCGETCNMAYLSDWMMSFRREHPLVQFRIRTATADDVKERIENGLLDMGLLVELKGEGRAMREARKHVGWYLHGLRGAAEFRRRAGQLCTLEDLDRLVGDVYQHNQQEQEENL